MSKEKKQAKKTHPKKEAPKKKTYVSTMSFGMAMDIIAGNSRPPLPEFKEKEE